MTHKSSQDSLRQQAEGLVKENPSASGSLSEEEAARLIHELRVHQIELELQNEELRRTQEDLTLSRDLFLQLFHQAPMGYLVLDEGSVILEVNETFCRMTGHDAASIKGKGFSRLIAEADRNPFLARYKAIFRNPAGKSLQSEILTARGKPMSARMEASPLRNHFFSNGGDSTCLLLTVTDITESKQAEEALRKSESLLRKIFDILPIGLWIADRNGKLMEGNPAGMKIWGAKPLVSQKDYGVFRARRLPSGKEVAPQDWALAHTVNKGVTVMDELLEIEALDGQKRIILNYTAPVKDAEGNVEAAVVVNQDITERKRMEDEREAVVHLLRLLNANNDLHELMRIVTGFLGNWFDVEAVGIRLKEEEDFPYFVTRGFTHEFIQGENTLCQEHSHEMAGQDSLKHQIPHCLCAHVLQGRGDPSSPFFTPNGGFWTNSATKLPPATGKGGRRGGTGNRCFRGGYESVALIPLRSGNETLGLLQLSDRRRDRFTEENLKLLERLAGSLSIAIMQRRAEAALHLERDNLRAIMHASPVGLVVIGEDLEVTDANGAAGLILLGNDESLEGKRCGVFMKCANRLDDPRGCGYGPLCSTCSLNNAIKDVLKGGPGVHNQDMEVPRRSNGRECFWITFSVEPVTLNGRRQALVSLADITERKIAEKEKEKLQAQFFQAQKMESVGQLAGGIAHDLNNLLSPILGYGELLLADFNPEDNRRGKLEQMVSAGMRARDLVRQLLAFSRKQTLEMKPVDLNRVLESFAVLLRRTIRENISMELHLSPSLPSIQGDVGQIEQVLMNLAVNAQDAMPEGGSLLLETSLVDRDDDKLDLPAHLEGIPCVRLTVQDTGCGIGAKVREHLFEPFFTTKEPGKGTGLGLATVYGIVKQHGGTIGAESQEGRGTAFHIHLPAMAAVETFPHEPQRVPLEHGGTETILLAEDNDQVRDLTRVMLERQGYEVMAAANGREALRVLQKHGGPIDLLLTDVIMPDMNGRELFSAASRLQPGLKVLFMSGYTADVIAHHGVLEKEVHFIQKPFTLNALTTKVHEVLQGGS